MRCAQATALLFGDAVDDVTAEDLEAIAGGVAAAGGGAGAPLPASEVVGARVVNLAHAVGACKTRSALRGAVCVCGGGGGRARGVRTHARARARPVQARRGGSWRAGGCT